VSKATDSPSDSPGGMHHAPLAVRVRGVVKVYPGRDGGPVTATTPARRGDRADTVALRSVSFDIRQGESVALLGPRDSGRSTLLRLLAGVLRPDEGAIGVHGRVGGSLAAGVGFTPKLLVRHNIVTSAVLLGMSRKDAKARVDEIASLARVEDLLGLQLGNLLGPERRRLAAVIALLSAPDVYLADDSLLVGDKELDEVIKETIRERAEQGGVLVLAGRPKTSGLKKLCSRGIVLDEGIVTFDGPLKEATRAMRENKKGRPDTGHEPPEQDLDPEEG
jgi:ABC-2 type transport system ATP-binding protein